MESSTWVCRKCRGTGGIRINNENGLVIEIKCGECNGLGKFTTILYDNKSEKEYYESII